MADGVNVSEMIGSERGDEQVYVATIERGGNVRSVEVTPKELRQLLGRERLRVQRLDLQLREAQMDGKPTTDIQAAMVTAAGRMGELQAIRNFMAG